MLPIFLRLSAENLFASGTETQDGHAARNVLYNRDLRKPQEVGRFGETSGGPHRRSQVHARYIPEGLSKCKFPKRRARHFLPSFKGETRVWSRKAKDRLFQALRFPCPLDRDDRPGSSTFSSVPSVPSPQVSTAILRILRRILRRPDSISAIYFQIQGGSRRPLRRIIVVTTSSRGWSSD
jgi:hypothetical protein